MSEFLEMILSEAKKNLRRIAFDEVEDERIVEAVVAIKKQGIAVPVLIGDKEIAKQTAKKHGIDISGIELIDPTEYDEFDDLVNGYVEIRKHKGMTMEPAREILQKPIYFAMMLLKVGKIDGIVSGAAHPTAHILRPALQIIKTREGIKTASSFFLMTKGDEQLFFADCAMNIQPDEDQLAEIALCTADSVKAFNTEPLIAMLSFSTMGSASHADVDKVRNATKKIRERRPDLLVDGELQFDAAYVESVAKKKCTDSKIAGKANVFIFPDLDAGNIGYKIAQRLGGYTAIGPIVQGLNKPVNDLSRGCSVEDIVSLCAITAVNV